MLIWLAKANGFVWLINLLILFFATLLGHNGLLLITNGFLSLLLLLETGLSLLVAGAVAFSGAIFPSKIREYVFHSEGEKWSIEQLKKEEKKAAPYIVLAAVLFVQSLVVSLLVL
ncbi:MAG: hypothetical protein ABSA75_12955 [Candidatus Bathyarchaeia archaeon]|jgi:hypothetical protein